MSIYLRPSPSHSGLTSLLGGEEQVYYHVGPLQYDFLRALYSGGSAVSATTFYSGSTDLSLLMGGTSTFVQDGNNTFTGGTPSRPTINIVLSPSFASMFAVAVSATTFYSAGTDLSRYMTGGTPTYVQPGSNTYTGGTAARPTVNVVTDPFFGDVTANNLTAATLISSPQVSADLGIFSDLEIQAFTVSDLTVTKHLYVGQLAEEIFGPTYVQNGTNTTTGGTETRPTVDVVADPFFNVVTVSSLDAGSLYAGSIGSQSINGGLLISGGTELSTIILRSRTRVIPGTNITTGGTFGAQTVGVVSDPTFDSVSAGSGVINGTLNVGTVNAGLIDASFIYSGGTNLSSLLTGGSRTMGVHTSTATTITPALSDANGLLIASAATAITVLIPTNATVAFPVGTQIMFEQGSTGQVRFSGATGVTLNSYGNAKNIVGQYATAFVTLTSSNRWVLDGNLTTLNL